MSAIQTRTGTVVGVFENQADAQMAIRELKEIGFAESEIGVVSQNQFADVEDQERRDADVQDGAAAGAAAGLGLGTLWGLAILAGVVPGIGPAIAGGSLGIIMSSAVTGAATAGLAGALLALGISEEEAAYYEHDFRAGDTIVIVQAGQRVDTAWAVLARSNARQR